MPDIFDVVADATRRDILRILLNRKIEQSPTTLNTSAGVSVSEIVTELTVSQPTVSKHLKVLREAGLVAVEERGQHRYYSFESQPLQKLDAWLSPFLSSEKGAAEESLVEATEDFLTEESRMLANKMGKVAADTTFHVSTMVDTVYPRHWRKDTEKS